MSKPFAIVAGVGPGTGAAVARKFSLQNRYPVALLARNPANYESLVSEINNAGGKAIGISTDVSSASSVSAAFQKIKSEFGEESGCAAAIFNASGRFFRKSILELTEEEFTAGYEVSCKGAFLFTKAAMPMLLSLAKKQEGQKENEGVGHYPPTLIYTGATASVKSSANMSSFSTGKYAMRALAQSTAREFAPQGVHVAHAIIDGVIDIPRTKDWLKDMPPEAKISADGVSGISTCESRSLLTAHRSQMHTGICTRSQRRPSRMKSISDQCWRSGRKRLTNNELYITLGGVSQNEIRTKRSAMHWTCPSLVSSSPLPLSPSSQFLPCVEPVYPMLLISAWRSHHRSPHT